jgi:DNA-directed RNA polymerase specialized sigma24 family protein
MRTEVDFLRLRAAALAGARAGGVEDAAEDIAHESILSLLALKHHVAHPYAYAFQKASWLALDWRRSARSRRQREIAWAVALPTVASSDPTIALHVEALLPSHLRGMTHLLEAGLSFSEIACSLRISKAAVQRRVAFIRRLVAA